MYPCDIAVWLQFPVLNLVFQYYCSGVNVEIVRGPTVSLGAGEPRELYIQVARGKGKREQP